MDGLRLILLVFGAILVAGVYFYSRRGETSRARSLDEMPRGREPRVRVHQDDDEVPDDMPSVRVDGDTLDIEDDAAAHAQPATGATGRAREPGAQKIVVLNILPADEEARFPGADLLDVFDRAGLEYGQYDVFHRVKETANGVESVFSVASATEPGSFDITTMAEESFRGITLFMQLPGPVRGVDAFADMLATARRIAEQIRGEVLDRQRSTLTRQTAHHIREEIIEFEHRLPTTS